MRALVFNRRLQIRDDYPVPDPGEDEALIRITHAGICKTDVEITRGYMGFQGVPGHEFVGMVEQCRDGQLVGKRVVGEINAGCEKCPRCRSRMQNHCPDRTVLGILNRDGVFAEYAVLPAGNLHVIPDSLSDLEAVFVEPLAAGFEILEQVSIRSSDRACVLGDGKLGLLAAQAIATTGSSVTLVGKHEEKLSVLEGTGIKTIVVNNFSGRDFDLVIDCTGSPSGTDSALQIVKPKGTVILKTTIAQRGPVDLNHLVINEISLIGSRCGPFPAAIDAIRAGQVKIEPLISRVFPLEEGLEAFRYAEGENAIKVILKIP